MRNRRIGILLSYGHTGLNMVVGLFLSAFLLRVLGDTEYGLYKTVSSFAGMLVLFEFGTGTVMTRNLTMCRAKKADPGEIESNISTIWVMTNLLAAFILAVSAIFFLSLGKLYSHSMTAEQIQYGRIIFAFITVYLLASFYQQTFSGVILAYEYYPYSSLLGILTLTGRVILLGCILLKFRYAVIVAIVDAVLAIGSAMVSYVFCIRCCGVRFSIRKFDRGIFYQVLPLCTAIFLQVVVNQANNNVDNFLIGILMTPESVALYSVALYIYGVFSSVTTIPITMYGPQVIKDVASGLRGKQLTETLVQPCRLVMLTGGTILFGFISCGLPFIDLVYGPQYRQSWLIALIIMVPMMINMSNGVIINVLDGMNKRMVRSKVLIATTLLNILLTVFWLKSWGMIGAAAATAVATLLGQVLAMNVYYSRNLGLRIGYLFRKTFSGILIYQIGGTAIAAAVGYWISSPVWKFLICGTVFVLLFLMGYIRYGATPDEKNLLRKAGEKVRK